MPVTWQQPRQWPAPVRVVLRRGLHRRHERVRDQVGNVMRITKPPGEVPDDFPVVRHVEVFQRGTIAAYAADPLRVGTEVALWTGGTVIGHTFSCHEPTGALQTQARRFFGSPRPRPLPASCTPTTFDG